MRVGAEPAHHECRAVDRRVDDAMGAAGFEPEARVVARVTKKGNQGPPLSIGNGESFRHQQAPDAGPLPVRPHGQRCDCWNTPAIYVGFAQQHMTEKNVALFGNELQPRYRDPESAYRPHDFALRFAASEGGRDEFVNRVDVRSCRLSHVHDASRVGADEVGLGDGPHCHAPVAGAW